MPPAALGEIGFGSAIATGFLTPLSAMGYVGVMCVAGWVGHRKNGFFIIKDGWEYVFVLQFRPLVGAAWPWILVFG